MTISALIVAAGRGQRMARDTPKQYLPLRGRAVLAHTIDALLASPLISHVRTVIHADDQQLYETALQGTTDDRILPPVPGGTTRSASVALGLQSLSAQAPDHVLIHDAARPFCPVDLIERVIAPLDQCDGAFAALPVVDAMWKAVDGYATSPVDRTGLWRAQTPQAFRYDAILSAHQQLPTPVADDVEVARLAGLTVQIVGGDERNFKITLPADLDRAERLIDGDF
ncbi:2-C-methyl-D-erythritol 4-phosphate cytidylyltransferase [Marivita sp.]|uniref:2-C-methyl-D-erythritol 4-phosphate cytidylyltransferase n=1 Tax=Marivita sp. TaxID=2003365 RepID=UPI0025C26273|nr:2-C-methyl-D-erythritol 4-phosphate cytidylyltransferase [Marivita sp.]